MNGGSKLLEAYLRPVFATFVWSLPRTFRDVEAAARTTVRLTIADEAGHDWLVVRDEAAWALNTDDGRAVAASVEIDEDAAWRMFTKGLSSTEARERSWPEKLLSAVAIIA